MCMQLKDYSFFFFFHFFKILSSFNFVVEIPTSYTYCILLLLICDDLQIYLYIFEFCIRYCILSITELYEPLLLSKCKSLQKRAGMLKVHIWLACLKAQSTYSSKIIKICHYGFRNLFLSSLVGQGWPSNNRCPQIHQWGRRGVLIYSSRLILTLV